MAPTKAKKKPAEKKPMVAEKASAKVEKKISKEGGSDLKKKKKKVKKSIETYKIYLFKVLKLHPDIGISSKGMGIMNSFFYNIFEKLNQESSLLARCISIIAIKRWGF